VCVEGFRGSVLRREMAEIAVNLGGMSDPKPGTWAKPFWEIVEVGDFTHAIRRFDKEFSFPMFVS